MEKQGVVWTRQTGNVKQSWAQELVELGKGSQPLVEGFLAVAGFCVVFIPVFGVGKRSAVGGRHHGIEPITVLLYCVRCAMVGFDRNGNMEGSFPVLPRYHMRAHALGIGID